MEVPQELIDQLEKSNKILLQAHRKPDGDAIGSLVALGKGLKALGKEVDYCVDTTIDPRLKFFPEMKFFNKDLKEKYDSLIIVDCSTKDFSVYPDKKTEWDNLITIDHHKSNQNYGDINFVYETAACGELVYQVLEKLNIPLDKEMREAIFTALSTDTGSFQFSNTNSQTHKIASKIYTKDDNFAPLSKRLHSTKSLEQLKLYGKAIESIELFDDGKIAILTLPYDVINEYGGIENVSDDLSNIGMNLDTSMISVLIKEQEPNEFKMSIRSKAPFDIDVSKLATKYGGGGHLRASGFSMEGNLEDIKINLVKDMEELLNE